MGEGAGEALNSGADRGEVIFKRFDCLGTAAQGLGKILLHYFLVPV